MPVERPFLPERTARRRRYGRPARRKSYGVDSLATPEEIHADVIVSRNAREEPASDRHDASVCGAGGAHRVVPVLTLRQHLLRSPWQGFLILRPSALRDGRAPA